MVVAHNLSAMNAYRQFGINAKSKAKTSEKLSSGYQINRAADDAAGLSISEKMRKQINGLERASMNSQDGISMVQIADGALSEINDMLNRCVELSVQAANGTLSVADRQAMQSEINEIRVEIDGIKEKTKFNEIKVLEPENPGVPVYVDGTGVEYYGALPDCIVSNEITNDKYMSYKYTTTETAYYTDNADNSVDANDNSLAKDFQVEHAAAKLDFSAFDSSKISDMIGKGMSGFFRTQFEYAGLFLL